jgi:hypothetical protein
VHELPKRRSYAVPRERFLGDGTRSLRGEEAGKSLTPRRWVNALVPPRWPMGKKPGELSAPNAQQSQLPQDGFDGHTLRHESHMPSELTCSDARLRIFHIAWGKLCLPARDYSSSGSHGECLSRMKRKSRFPSSLSRDRTTKRRGYALPGATPPSACCQGRYAPLSRWPGQRSAARQTPHIPSFFHMDRARSRYSHARDSASGRVHGRACLLRDGLCVAVIELTLRIDVHVQSRQSKKWLIWVRSCADFNCR